MISLIINDEELFFQDQPSYFELLADFLDASFVVAERTGVSDAVLAKKTGLAPATIHNQNMKVGPYPQFRTVFKIAKAVSLHKELVRALSELAKIVR